MLKFLLGIFRPVCPACDGEGGSMSGYYEPEFSECSCCYEDPWWEESNPTRVWRWRTWKWRYAEWRNKRHWERLYSEQEHRFADMRTREDFVY